MSVENTLTKFRIFFQMIKFEHSVFALPFAYLGLFLAEDGAVRWDVFGWVTLAMVSFRTLGMSLNRIFDRVIDAQNPRTRSRALPAGRLNPGFVWAAAAVSWLIFELSAYALNPLCFKLSWVPTALAFLYPWTKRFTWLSHFNLGIILGIAPYGAWLASRGSFSWIPGFLTLGVSAWVAGFDIIYALQDEQFDREAGLYSLPARFGKKKALWVTRCLHVFALAAWGLAGVWAGLGWIYNGGLVLVAFFLFYENRLIRREGLVRIQDAFFTMNAVVSVALFVAVIADLWV